MENAFIGRETEPAEADLEAVLGSSKRLWDELVAGQIGEWNSYSLKAGWALRLKQKKRNIVYLGPRQGGFVATFVLGGKAMGVARESGFSARVTKLLDEAKKYPEGTAVRIEVKKAADVAVVRKLMAIKIAN